MEQRYVHTSISLVQVVLKLNEFCKVFQFLAKSYMNHSDITWFREKLFF